MAKIKEKTQPIKKDFVATFQEILNSEGIKIGFFGLIVRPILLDGVDFS